MNNIEIQCNIENDGTVNVYHKGRGTSMNFGRVSISDLLQCYEKWKAGYRIQFAFEEYNADQREFIMTGITPEIWNEMFASYEE
jgi:hypothetical protein